MTKGCAGCSACSDLHSSFCLATSLTSSYTMLYFPCCTSFSQACSANSHHRIFAHVISATWNANFINFYFSFRSQLTFLFLRKVSLLPQAPPSPPFFWVPSLRCPITGVILTVIVTLTFTLAIWSSASSATPRMPNPQGLVSAHAHTPRPVSVCGWHSGQGLYYFLLLLFKP